MGFTGSSGLKIVRSIDIDSTADDISTVPCTVHGWALSNSTAAVAWFKLYDKAAATSADTPVITFMIPAGGSANVSFEHGIKFYVACSCRVTTGVADNDTGDPGASIVGNFFIS